MIRIHQCIDDRTRSIGEYDIRTCTATDFIRCSVAGSMASLMNIKWKNPNLTCGTRSGGRSKNNKKESVDIEILAGDFNAVYIQIHPVGAGNPTA